jgi:hypothetical protein
MTGSAFALAFGVWLQTSNTPAIASPRVNDPPSYGPPIAHALGLFVVQRGTEAYLYPEPFARTEPSFWGARYKEAFTRPPLFDRTQPAFRWDYDPLAINLLGHALMGSELYQRARACRFTVLGALAFTAAASTTWEYLFEGNGVRPSAQDLVYTPLAGLALGEARVQLHRLAGGLGSPFARSVLTAVVDPFGELERRAGVFGC